MISTRSSLLLATTLCLSPLQAQHTWQLDAGAAPPANGLEASAFDSVRGTGVLFGGTTYGASGASNQTWLWNGQWQQVTPATVPPARNGAGMTYDAARGVIVMFGGFSGTQHLNDTWTWDGTNWAQQQPQQVPPARTQMAFAYDPQSQKCLLFSGGFPAWAPIADTWEWDGANWISRSPSTSPHWRANARLDYNGTRLTLTGGFSSSGGWSAHPDVWEWTGLDWVQTSVNALYCFCGTNSGGRASHASFYDSARGRLVLYGGTRNAGIYSTTMEYDGTTWSQVTMPSPPAARFMASAFFDSWRGVGVMHGGFSSSNPTWSQPFAQTWTYSGPSPASVVAYTAGCTGPSGTPTLSVMQRPILGQTYELALSTPGPMAFPWMITGWSMVNLDLALVLTQAHPTCVLGASPDVFQTVFGATTYAMPIPSAPSLMGLALHQQLAYFEFDANTEWVGLSVSASVRATIGNP